MLRASKRPQGMGRYEKKSGKREDKDLQVYSYIISYLANNNLTATSERAGGSRSASNLLDGVSLGASN